MHLLIVILDLMFLKPSLCLINLLHSVLYICIYMYLIKKHTRVSLDCKAKYLEAVLSTKKLSLDSFSVWGQSSHRTIMTCFMIKFRTSDCPATRNVQRGSETFFFCSLIPKTSKNVSWTNPAARQRSISAATPTLAGIERSNDQA